MSLYEFQNGKGEIIEEFFPMGKIPKGIVRHGTRYRRIISRPRLKREVLQTQTKGVGYHGSKRWRYSRSIGCAKSQVAERNTAYQEAGFRPDEVCAMPDGRVRMAKGFRNKAMAFHGTVDADGGYSDRTDASKMYGVKRPEAKKKVASTGGSKI